MAEGSHWWTEMWLRSPLFLSLSLSFSLSSLFLSFSLCFSLSFSDYLPTYLLIYLSIYLPIYLSVCLSIDLPVYLQAWKRSYSARLLHFAKLTTSKMQQFCETSSMFELDNIKNEATLRDFLIFRSRQHQKRSNSAKLLQFLNWATSKTNNSARLLQFANLTTSKTDEFCEASFKNGNLSVELTASYQCVLRFFQSTCLRLPRKSDAKSYEVLHLSRKIISAKLKIRCSKMQPVSGNQRPDLLTSLMNMTFVPRPPREMPLWRSSSNVPRLPLLLEMPQNPHVLLTFDKVHNPLRLPRESTSECPKVLRTRQFFALLTSKCASRHNGVHFFDISTTKSGPKLVCFVHFYVKMCFAPQRRAIFRLSSGQMAPHPPL